MTQSKRNIYTRVETRYERRQPIKTDGYVRHIFIYFCLCILREHYDIPSYMFSFIPLFIYLPFPGRGEKIQWVLPEQAED